VKYRSPFCVEKNAENALVARPFFLPTKCKKSVEKENNSPQWELANWIAVAIA